MRKRQFTALLYGWVVVLGLILLTSVILALLLRFTEMDGAALSWTTLIAGLICLFIGGIVSGIKSKQKGWVIGGITGLGFTLFTFLIQYLGYEQSFSLQQTLHHLGYILAALLGGMIGVNMTSGQEE
ncbi:TIGR04086 family membrane protein [Virgibacillus siamensis]|uniref:TIGR04086 family membrane protein n=1 Tax=Virgibacillus siamensis TaxID=480071 RepID=UPI0031D46E38